MLAAVNGSRDPSFFRRGVAIGLIAFLVSVGAAAAESQGAALSARVDADRGVLEWWFKDRCLLTYAFATNQFKPYVRAWFTLGGENVLRDAPPDHLHHHGLMYAVRVNDINFWEENSRPGVQRHVAVVKRQSGRDVRGRPQAVFTELIHWLGPDDRERTDSAAVALLVEHRTLALSVDEVRGEVVLGWHAEFAVGPRTNRVTLAGTDYNGLGLRLPAAWDRVARHRNSEGAPYPTGGRRDVFPARWAAVSGPLSAGGGTAQVMLGARPSGHAGTNTFFSMLEPFSYLAVTQGLDRTPLEFRAGDRFQLDYFLLAADRELGPAELESRFQAWARELGRAGRDR